MPILESVDPSSPLSQGDLLKDINLHMTSVTGEAKALAKTNNALILSRDCVVANKSKLIVAAIASVNIDMSLLKEAPNHREKNFRNLHDKLIAMRDSDESPDRFYLGTPPQGGGLRLIAKLDEIFTIECPKSQTELSEWTNTHRVAKLSDKFLRALPVRIFGAFARIGFDDYGWFPTEDLELLVNCGNAYLSELDASVSEKQTEAGLMSGDNSKRIKDASTAQQKRDAFKQELAGYIEEIGRRKKPHSAG